MLYTVIIIKLIQNKMISFCKRNQFGILRVALITPPMFIIILETTNTTIFLKNNNFQFFNYLINSLFIGQFLYFFFFLLYSEFDNKNLLKRKYLNSFITCFSLATLYYIENRHVKYIFCFILSLVCTISAYKNWYKIKQVSSNKITGLLATMISIASLLVSFNIFYLNKINEPINPDTKIYVNEFNNLTLSTNLHQGQIKAIYLAHVIDGHAEVEPIRTSNINSLKNIRINDNIRNDFFKKDSTGYKYFSCYLILSDFNDKNIYLDYLYSPSISNKKVVLDASKSIVIDNNALISSINIKKRLQHLNRKINNKKIKHKDINYKRIIRDRKIIIDYYKNIES